MQLLELCRPLGKSEGSEPAWRGRMLTEAAGAAPARPGEASPQGGGDNGAHLTGEPTQAQEDSHVRGKP